MNNKTRVVARNNTGIVGECVLCVTRDDMFISRTSLKFQKVFCSVDVRRVGVLCETAASLGLRTIGVLELRRGLKWQSEEQEVTCGSVAS
jgi:hypothetical protein